jgi:hypothetical protein
MFDGDDVCCDDTVGCKQMGRHQRLMQVTVCIVTAFGIAAPACASGAAAKPGQAALNADVARAAIARAERAVGRAQAQHMLWTTSEEALRGARRAFEDGDIAAAVAQAQIAKEHAELAIAQKRYPLFRI